MFEYSSGDISLLIIISFAVSYFGLRLGPYLYQKFCNFVEHYNRIIRCVDKLEKLQSTDSYNFSVCENKKINTSVRELSDISNVTNVTKPSSNIKKINLSSWMESTIEPDYNINPVNNNNQWSFEGVNVDDRKRKLMFAPTQKVDQETFIAADGTSMNTQMFMPEAIKNVLYPQPEQNGMIPLFDVRGEPTFRNGVCQFGNNNLNGPTFGNGPTHIDNFNRVYSSNLTCDKSYSDLMHGQLNNKCDSLSQLYEKCLHERTDDDNIFTNGRDEKQNNINNIRNKMLSDAKFNHLINTPIIPQLDKQTDSEKFEIITSV